MTSSSYPLKSIRSRFSIGASDFISPRQEVSHARSSWRSTLAVWLIVIIAGFDLAIVRTNFAILYVVPMVLMARVGARRSLRLTTWMMIGLTYGIYVLKNAVNPHESIDDLLDYRFINRSFVVLTLLVMNGLLQIWMGWQEEQADPELPGYFRDQDREIHSTLALVWFVALLIPIAVIDYFMPAEINHAIWYPVPLFICAWTGSRRLLWSMFVVMCALTVINFMWGGPPTSTEFVDSLPRNRVLVILMLSGVTAILHIWVGRENRKADFPA